MHDILLFIEEVVVVGRMVATNCWLLVATIPPTITTPSMNNNLSCIIVSHHGLHEQG